MYVCSEKRVVVVGVCVCVRAMVRIQLCLGPIILHRRRKVRANKKLKRVNLVCNFA